MRKRIAGMVLLLIGVGCLLLTDFTAVDLVRGPTQMQELSALELENQYVETEVHAVFDWFASYTPDGDEEAYTAYFIIPLAQQEGYVPLSGESYIALAVPPDTRDDVVDVYMETLDYLYEVQDGVDTTVTVRGTVVPMEDDLAEFYRESDFFTYYDAGDYSLPLVLEVGSVLGYSVAFILGMSAAGALLILLGLYFLLRTPAPQVEQFTTGERADRAERAVDESGDYSAVLTGLDPDIANDYRRTKANAKRGRDPWDY